MEVGLLWKKSRDSQFIMRCYSKLMIPSTVRWTFQVTIPYSLDLYTAVSEFRIGWRGSDFVGFHGWDFPSVSSFSLKVVVRREDVEPAPVVHKVDQDNAINRINLYPLDSAIGFPNIYHWIVIYPVDSVIHLLNSRGLANSRTRKDGRKRATKTIGLKTEASVATWTTELGLFLARSITGYGV